MLARRRRRARCCRTLEQVLVTSGSAEEMFTTRATRRPSHPTAHRRRCGCAGHPPPLLLSDGRRRARRRAPGGPPLGVVDRRALARRAELELPARLVAAAVHRRPDRGPRRAGRRAARRQGLVALVERRRAADGLGREPSPLVAELIAEVERANGGALADDVAMLLLAGRPGRDLSALDAALSGCGPRMARAQPSACWRCAWPRRDRRRRGRRRDRAPDGRARSRVVDRDRPARHQAQRCSDRAGQPGDRRPRLRARRRRSTFLDAVPRPASPRRGGARAKLRRAWRGAMPARLARPSPASRAAIAAWRAEYAEPAIAAVGGAGADAVAARP